MELFHYHLVTSRIREVEARYVGKLGFGLVARHGRIGEDYQSVEPGVPWDELDRLGFRLRLSELERGSVNVVVQPGQWDLPRVDHVGLALDEEEFGDVIDRATTRELRIQTHGGRRTFVATNVGYRLEIHPPREWLGELLASSAAFALTELHLLSEDPGTKATVLAELFHLERDGGDVQVGGTLVRFLPGGPPGRPQLHAELFT
ncbi:MAG: hypothetical protein WKF41_01020 [Gaiellaceae bacterium]